VTAGPGLTGGGSTGNVTLALDAAFTDARYLQPNGNGSGLSNVNAATLNGLPASAFAQAGAANTMFAGGASFGGNVGIGTLVPSARLEVAGDVRISGVGSTLAVGGNILVAGTTLFGFRDGTLTVAQGGADTAATFGCGSSSPPSCLPVQINVNDGQKSLSIRNQTTSTEVASVDSSGGITANLLNLPATTGSPGFALPTAGFISIGGSPFAHSFAGNTFLGPNAGNFSTTGSENTATGERALQLNTTGAFNIAYGVEALRRNLTGNGNTAMGWHAGVSTALANSNFTGSFNTFLGFQSAPGTFTQLTNATALGANAKVNCDNCMVLGDSTMPMMVGIRTDSPSEAFEVTGNAKISGPGNGLIFPDGSVQTTAATGGGGGGGGNGTVTSVGSGLGLVGGPITTSGTLAIDPAVVPQLSAPNNAFSGDLTASLFNGSGAGLSNVNAALLGGNPPSAFATTGANTFAGDQNITGNVSLTGALNLTNIALRDFTLPTGGTGGVITLGGAPFAYAYGRMASFPATNTLLGPNAGNFTMSGAENTALGVNALQLNNNGSENTALGAFALESNVGGHFNTAIGSLAMMNNSGGSGNSALGRNTLSANTSGDNNTATGVSALLLNTTGSGNTAVGMNAGGAFVPNGNTTGSNNTFVGLNAGPGTASQLDNAAAIGANALVNCSNCMVLGDSTKPMMVGVRTKAPSEAFEVMGNAKISGVGNGLIFPDGSVQTTASTGGGGSITAVNTPAGGGLMGGGNSGALNLSLLNSCATGQVLQWTGVAWMCATVSSAAGVTSVTAGTGLTATPNPIISSGSLAVDPAVVPQLGASNTFTGSPIIFKGQVAVGTSSSSAVFGVAGGDPSTLSLPEVFKVSDVKPTSGGARFISIKTGDGGDVPASGQFAGQGGAITIASGNGGNAVAGATTGSGGTVQIQGGSSGFDGTTMAQAGTGGSIILGGGLANTSGSNGTGGPVTILGGSSGSAGATLGSGGAITINGGQPNGAGGGISIAGGGPIGFLVPGTGGNVTIAGGGGPGSTRGIVSLSPRVGINNSAPTQALDVVGNANISSNLAAGGLSTGGNLIVSGNASVFATTTLGILNVSAGASIVGGATVDNLTVTGSLSKPAGSFKIDHPLDPENRILYHSFVESPDMKNVYDGVVTLNSKGQAWVELPPYFEALNKDYRYQLTSIGAPAPNLYVAQEVRGNRFQIAGGIPGGKVSWQITGTRQDAYAQKHRIPVEEEKPVDEQGFYLSPDSFGQPKEKGVAWARAHSAAPKTAPAKAQAATQSAQDK
jgi:hypothetical protein